MTAANAITVYGASDDLVEIDGAIREEFAYHEPQGEDQQALISISDGSLLSIEWTRNGTWALRIVALGAGTSVTLTPATGPDSDNYSDRVELIAIDPFAWVAFDGRHAKARY